MTVGVPETNLDTWGLKYVKKKSSTEGIDTGTGSGTPDYPKHTGLPESKRPRSEGRQAGAGFESGKPSKNISATNRISDADVKTPDSPKGTHGTQGSDIDRQHHRDDPKITGTPTNRKVEGGKVIHEGESRGLTVSGLGETGKPRKLTAQGKPSDTRNVQNPDAVASGREASYDSGHRSVEARSGKDRVGGKVDPEKVKPTPRGAKTTREAGDKPKGTTGTVAATDKPALPKVKAEMALVIIKCKLLKMKTKKKDFIEEGRPTRPAYRKDDDDDDKVEKGTKDYGSDNSGSAQIPDTGDGKPTPDKQSVKDPPTSPSRYRADESEVTSYGEGSSGALVGEHKETGKPREGSPYHGK